MIDKLIKKYTDLLNTLRENKKLVDSTDHYPYNLDIKNTREYLKDLKALKKQLTMHVVGSRRELLIAYENWRAEQIKPDDTTEEAVDFFLKTSN